MTGVAQIAGDLAEHVRRGAILTAREVSQVVRQGLMRVVSEAEAPGSFTWHSCSPPARICSLTCCHCAGPGS